jgi:hypothetical protein
LNAAVEQSFQFLRVLLLQSKLRWGSWHTPIIRGPAYSASLLRTVAGGHRPSPFE